MTSSRAPFAGLSGVFGDPALNMPIVPSMMRPPPQDANSHLPMVGPLNPPPQVAGAPGPPFMIRPLTSARTDIYGPPFGLRPGPLPRQDTGINKNYLKPYPNDSWAGLGDAGLEAALAARDRKAAEGKAFGNLIALTALVGVGLVALNSWAKDVEKRAGAR